MFNKQLIITGLLSIQHNGSKIIYIKSISSGNRVTDNMFLLNIFLFNFQMVLWHVILID